MLHALLVDDDDDFLTGLAEITRQEGFEVTLASSLREARISSPVGRSTSWSSISCFPTARGSGCSRS